MSCFLHTLFIHIDFVFVGIFCLNAGQAVISVGTAERICNNLDFALENAADGELDNEFNDKVHGRIQQFITAMDDDMNTADAIAAVFELVRDINTVIAAGANKATLELAAKAFDELTDVLGLVYNRSKASLDDEVEELIAQRAQARKDKNWALADEIRDKIKAMGIVLEDTPQGVKWHKA